MISRYSKQDYEDGLRSLGIPRSSVVVVSASFFELGCPTWSGDRRELAKTLCDLVREVFPEPCTLVGNTFTTDVARFGRPFVCEEKSTTTGFFNEWLLNQPDRVRSLHPINSVAALGPKARTICDGTSRSNYGYNSPYWRMSQMDDVWLLRIGLTPYLNCFDHLAEALCDVPYLYNKWLDVEVWAEGQVVPGPWLASVRYLHFDLAYDFARLARLVEPTGLLRRARVGAGYLTAFPAGPYFKLVADALSRDPFFLMAESFDIPHGLAPRDGLTQGRDGVRQRLRPMETGG